LAVDKKAEVQKSNSSQIFESIKSASEFHAKNSAGWKNSIKFPATLKPYKSRMEDHLQSFKLGPTVAEHLGLCSYLSYGDRNLKQPHCIHWHSSRIKWGRDRESAPNNNFLPVFWGLY